MRFLFNLMKERKIPDEAMKVMEVVDFIDWRGKLMRGWGYNPKWDDDPCINDPDKGQRLEFLVRGVHYWP